MWFSMNANDSGQAAGERRDLVHVESELRVADEGLVVEQDSDCVVVTADEPDRCLVVESRLAEDGVALPHPRECRVGVGAERVTVEVVLPLGRRHCPMLPRPSRRLTA